MKFAPKLPIYCSDGIRIQMTLTNNSHEPLTIPCAYTLEKQTESGWAVPEHQKEDDFGEADNPDVQFPIEPGETRTIGVYIGAIRKFNKKLDSERLPTGNYRLTMRVNDQFDVTGEFAIQDEELVQDTSRYEIKTTKETYDANVEKIEYLVTNKTDKQIGYGEYVALEQLVEDVWKPCKVIGDLVFTDMATSCSPNSSNTETLLVAGNYKQPMKPGRYRLVKQLSDDYQKSYAEFTITAAK